MKKYSLGLWAVSKRLTHLQMMQRFWGDKVNN